MQRFIAVHAHGRVQRRVDNAFDCPVGDGTGIEAARRDARFQNVCKLHKFRRELAKKCKREHLADTYGTFDGGRLVNVEEYLDNYRYSIVVENDIEAYWFTEKIVNCFATMTIPVYIGATKIGEFFNEDGIIRITEKDFDNIDKILKQCTKEEYESRIDILKENFEKSKQFCGSSWDRLYKKYLKEDLEK